MAEWQNKSGNVRVKFWLLPSIILSIVLSLLLTLILNLVF